MPFQKGQVANPFGARVKSLAQREFEAKCKEWCRLFAYDRLRDKIDSKNEKISAWALEVMLNRAFGKPVETSVIDSNVTIQPSLTVADIERGIDDVISGKVGESVPVNTEPPMDAGK